MKTLDAIENRLTAMPRPALEQAMLRIVELLYPRGRVDADWNGGDVCEALSRILGQHKLDPHSIRCTCGPVFRARKLHGIHCPRRTP